jgi:hypothetical protein
MRVFGAYLHCKPDATPFYVGKGDILRAKRILNRRHNRHHMAVVSKYGVEGISVGFIPCSSEQLAFILEVGLIKCLRRAGFRLANRTDGGEGHTGPKSPEHLHKLRKALIGRPGTMRGRKHTAEASEKMRAASSGNTHRRGKRNSPETVKRQRQVALEQWTSVEARARQRELAQAQMRTVVACGVVFESRHAYAAYVKRPLSTVSRWARRGWQDKIDAAYMEVYYDAK